MEPGPDDTQEFFPTGAQSAVNVAASSTPLFEEKSIEEKFFGETAGTAPEAPPEPVEEIAAPAPKPQAEHTPATPDATPEMDATVIADTSALRALAATPPSAAEPPPKAPAAEPESKVESNADTPEAAKKPPPDDDATVLADTRALQALQDAADDDATVLAVPPPRHNK